MKIFKQAIRVSIVLLILCGLIYPAAMTGLGQLTFNKKANGSIVEFDGKAAGSSLIGQNFMDARFFKGRVSSVNYNTHTEADKKADSSGKTKYSGPTSGSSNLAPSSKELTDRVQKDINSFLAAHSGIKKEDIPADLLTASGSGLDPNISPKAAEIQIPAVSKASGINETTLKNIVNKNTEGRSLGIFGEPRVNVLKVNLEIAEILKKSGKL